MITFEEKRTTTYIIGDSVEELLDYAMPRIRRVSKEFYSKDIPATIAKDGETLIDCHAIGQRTMLVLRST